jgi:hypothetical protein
MFKILAITAALSIASVGLANAGGDPSPGAVSENAVILGTVSVASANAAIAAVGLGSGATLRGTSATVTRTPTGAIVVTTDAGQSFTVQGGFVAQLILAYFT